MKNPKDFQATPFTHKKVIDKSGPSKELKHNATRPWNGPTPYNHSKPTKHSGGEGIGNPMGVEKAEVLTPFNHMKPNSGPYHPGIGNPKEPRKWKSKGYSMGMDD